MAAGVPHGGWCPRGRRAEDGPIPAHYRLKETASASYLVQTRRNIEDADATVTLTLSTLSGGSKLTADLADQMGKPWLHIRLDRADDTEAANMLRTFIARHCVEELNVAGSRESREPGIYQKTLDILGPALGRFHGRCCNHL